nr:peptidase M20 domain-containing protein 2-like [Rhipicephalus microplus]XP_037285357.1 peptidase M20 domain-containing protein 2-like [Rhipicephalus microplus]
MKSHEQLSGVPLQGRVVVLGTPAEEGGMGKELLLRAGALDGVDAALMAHPEKDNALRVILSARCGVTALFEYAGEEHDVQSSALDAAVLAYSGLSLIRARMDPECRMHGVFLRSEATSELEVHRSQLHFCVRAPSAERLLKVRTQLEACMEAAAKATGCNVHIAEKEIFCKHMNLNEPLLRIFQRHAEAQGLLFEDNNACRVQLSGATSDIGNVSHVVPTITSHVWHRIRISESYRRIRPCRRYQAVAGNVSRSWKGTSAHSLRASLRPSASGFGERRF